MKISAMIKLTGVIVLFISVLILGIVYMLNNSVQERETAIERQIEFKQLAEALHSSSDYLTNEVRSYVQFGNAEHYDNYWREVNETKTRDNVVIRLQELNTPQELLELIEEAKANSDTLISLEEQAMKAVEEKDFDKARQLVFGDQYDAGKELIVQPMEEFKQKLENLANQEAEFSSSRLNTFLAITIISIIIFMIVALTAGFILFRKIKPLNHLTKIAEQISTGNLRVEEIHFKSKDEVAQLTLSINTMANNIRNLIQEAAGISEKVATSSEEMTASSSEMKDGITEELASGSTNQAMHAAETLEIIVKVNNDAKKIVENSETMSESSRKANAASNNGLQSVNKSIEQMRAIEGQVSSTAANVRTLGEKSQEINQILGV